ncbi:DUF4382 domain-containing protein [Armatimonas sp.]|uniref:DUF4382 domain-containing protein n=1 Tax=Armatimonas sp. TaxID=1872638 RepID=UPI003750A299
MKFVKITALSIAVGALSIAMGALMLAGCGGGGTSALTGSRATILVTDSPREDYGHIWATIYHVELTPQGGGAPVVVFDNAAGVTLDLRTLRDASGARYSFLSSATVPAGTYTGVSITVASTMQLIKTGQTTGTSLTVDASVARDVNGNAVIPVTFRSPKTISATATNICIDFDLARFIVRGSNILPSVVEGDGAGLSDPARHEKDDYHGTVSAISGTAPTLSFTLTMGSGQTVAVTTTASTALYGATLTEGAKVEIEGTLDTTAQTLVATKLEVRGTGSIADDWKTPRAGGVASALNAAAGTFTLTIQRAGGFTVAGTTVSVVTNASTVFRGDKGAMLAAADFYAALATTPNVGVEGTYDATTNTLTATKARAFDPRKDGIGKVGQKHDFRDAAEHGSGGDAVNDHGWGNESTHGGGGNSGHGNDN